MKFDAAGMSIGTVRVVTTDNGPLPPEHFAERIVDKLIYIGDQAPQPIRDQALAFKGTMLAIVLAGIRAAIDSDRAYRK
jgi:hypothetical protein